MTKNEMLSSVASTAEILADFRAGKMVILIDDEDRENEGDLLIAADFVTPEAINFMARHARGLVCLTLTEERCRRLRLPLMTAVNGTKMSTNFTMSIEAAEGVTTGISAADRARTIQAAVAADAKPSDIVQPGHVFPVMARPGGVLTRAGHTEAGCDLGALTGLTPSAVICEIMKEDGTMARLPDLIEFAREHGLKIGTIADLIAYRSAHESMIERIGQHKVQTVVGELDLIAYRDKTVGQPHLALVVGKPKPDHEAWVRVHEPLSPLDLLGVASPRRRNGHRPDRAMGQSRAGSRPCRQRQRLAHVAQLRHRRPDPAGPGGGAHETVDTRAPDAEHGGLQPGSDRLSGSGRRRPSSRIKLT